MFYQPKFWEKTGSKLLSVTPETDIIFPNAMKDSRKEYIRSRLLQSAAPKGTGIPKLTLTVGSVPDDLCKLPLPEEAFYLTLAEDGGKLIAPTEQALLNGITTLCHMEECGESVACTLVNCPEYPIRGYRGFLPGPGQLSDFYEMVDRIADYGYNMLFLEIGGAMEYRRHPEINEKWVEYAAYFREKSGRSFEVQNGQPYSKNSIHADNGDGAVLSQKTCRELVAYCRDRGIEVCPEAPLLSHCDYLVNAYPEFSERQEDAYPDTYCPNAPGVYDLVFDVIDEIIAVFKPKMFHIGHDEAYSIGVCPRCRNLDPADLYADDIIKIHDHLAEKNIRTVMWGEKLLQISAFGRDWGGVERWGKLPDGTAIRLQPKLYPCADKLPKDILMMHWYWRFDTDTKGQVHPLCFDEVYEAHGFDMIYSNVSFVLFPDFAPRRDLSKGGVCSNWGSYAPEYMQRNKQYFDIAYNGFVLWNSSYTGTEENIEETVCRTMEELWRYAHRKAYPTIRVRHRTDLYIPYQCFYDGAFIEDETYLLGHYVLTYADGTQARLPVKYGSNISYGGLDRFTIDTYADTMISEPTSYYRASVYHEVGGGTMPQIVDDAMVYTTDYADPHPDKKLIGFTYEPVRKDASVETLSLEQL